MLSKDSTGRHVSKFIFILISKALTLGLVLCLFSSASAVETAVHANISRIGDAAHLELTGLSNWKYEIKKQTEAGKNVLVLETKPLDEKSMLSLRTYSDELIEKMTVKPQSIDDLTEVRIYLKKANLDSFDYLSEEPSRWVIDIFPKEQTKTPAKTAEAAGQNLKKPTEEKRVALPARQTKALLDEDLVDESDVDHSRNIADDWPAKSGKDLSSNVDYAPIPNMKSGRKPTSDSLLLNPDFQDPRETKISNHLNQGAFDGGDPDFKRFSIQDYEVKENSVIASRANIYLHFPMLDLGTPELDKLAKTPPIYKILPLDEKDNQNQKLNQENQEASLLASLFEKERYAIFLKSAREFLKEYPVSRYEEIIRYMMADTYFKFWQESKNPDDFDTAMAMYRGVSEKYKESPLAARTHLFVAYSYLDRGDNLNAIKAFQRFLELRNDDKSFDQKKLTPQIKIAEAKSFLNLGRLDESFKILDEVEKTAPDKKDSITAAYHKGDIFFQNGDYKRAVHEYRYAQKTYPKDWASFPNAYFNSAEADFWLGNYRDCLNSYREFLQKFPNNQYGGFAMTRIGELLAAMGADPKRVRGAFLESSFRYKGTPGGSIARVRLIADRLPEMKDKELKNAIEEVKEIEKNVKLQSLDEFTNFLIADGYYNRGDFESATGDLIKYYQNNPIAKNRDKYKARIERNITTSIRKNAEQNKFLEALKVYGHYANNWLSGSDRIDTEFYVGRAYEQAGVLKEADKIYRETLNKTYALQGTQKQKERNVFEVLPSTDGLNLRLAAIANQEREFSKAFNYLKEIKNPENLNEADLVERAQISADVFEERGDLVNSNKFLQSLVDTWKGQPIAVTSIYLRLARLEMQANNYKAAETHLTKITNLQNDTALVPADIYAKTLELKGDLALAQKRKRDAVKSYQDLLSQYESKRPMSSIRYKLGQILFDLGDLKEAETTWNLLKGDKNDKSSTWYRLASEKMTSSNWKREYKKYIERIPAMADANTTR
jgi:tetratricopeptide (TPR) repeat protein